MKSRTTQKNGFLNLGTEKSGGRQNKIELVSCKNVNSKCTSIIAGVNEDFQQFELFWNDKNFEKAIESLKHAYLLTFAFTEKSCVKCGDLTRATIIESLENIAVDLEKCSKGLFKRMDLQTNIKLAERVIKELKAIKGSIDD